MATFPVHTLDTAPEDARALMDASIAKYKVLPNLHAVMAESPQLFEAYRVIIELYRACSLSTLERQVVVMTINHENNCDYCMAAHSVLAQRERMPDPVLAALRAGEPLPEPKLDALARFARALVAKRGWADPSDLDAFFAAGYAERQVLDVVLAIGYKTLSNYTNQLANTPLDAMFASQAWTKP
ncbi:MAG: carboxymuconolactone decarboxylase family protein [Maricaulaceae bacterium]